MNKFESGVDPKKIRILFMGSPTYAATILKVLVENHFNIASVVSQPDKKVGRGKTLQSPPVKLLADELKLKTLQPKSLKSEEFQMLIEKLDPELIIVAAYGRILRKNVLEYPKFGCINVHASLLPRWRGASPVHAAILHGDRTSGVTIMKMDEGIDTGDILSKRQIELSLNETTLSLTNELSIIGADLLIDTLPKYIMGEIEPRIQNNENASYAGMLQKIDGLIDFNKSAEEIERMVRAFDPWPIAFFSWDKKNIKIFKIEIMSSKKFSAGYRGIVDKYPCIGTGTFDIKLCELQVPGKKRIDGRMFLNGARNWVG